MTSSAPTHADYPPLVDLLDREFEAEGLRQLLGAVVEHVPSAIWHGALKTPLEDVLSRPGKAFRARMVDASYALAGGPPPLPEQVPVLVELLHAGSLVVDDIEDDSESRRGVPSLHVTYGTPVALNAGNWIYFWALRLVEHLPVSEATQLGLLRRMSSAMLACHFGQALDLSVVVDEVPRTQVPPLVRASTELKTGRLMQLAAELGAVTANAGDMTQRALAHFGCQVGTGLQMLDDLGGLTSPRRKHKGFEDLRLGRLTWPWAWAAEREQDVSYARLRELQRDVRAGRAPAERLGSRLCETLGDTGRQRVREHLALALATLEQSIGPSELLTVLAHEIIRLQESYD